MILLCILLIVYIMKIDIATDLNVYLLYWRNCLKLYLMHIRKTVKYPIILEKKWSRCQKNKRKTKNLVILKMMIITSYKNQALFRFILKIYHLLHQKIIVKIFLIKNEKWDKNYLIKLKVIIMKISKIKNLKRKKIEKGNDLKNIILDQKMITKIIFNKILLVLLQY